MIVSDYNLLQQQVSNNTANYVLIVLEKRKTGETTNNLFETKPFLKLSLLKLINNRNLTKKPHELVVMPGNLSIATFIEFINS